MTTLLQLGERARCLLCCFCKPGGNVSFGMNSVAFHSVSFATLQYCDYKISLWMEWLSVFFLCHCSGCTRVCASHDNYVLYCSVEYSHIVHMWRIITCSLSFKKEVKQYHIPHKWSSCHRILLKYALTHMISIGNRLSCTRVEITTQLFYHIKPINKSIVYLIDNATSTCQVLMLITTHRSIWCNESTTATEYVRGSVRTSGHWHM